jgi:short subunit dehydrogenase-like uncharacterized protein
MSNTDNTQNRRYDVIVWGATGFTGRLVAEYLASRYRSGDSLRWAIGGRNRDKLDSLSEDLGLTRDGPDLIIADSHDAQAMQDLARSTRVVLTTVGPYAHYGSELVAACVATGTHYCDLCGESQWIRKMIDRHHAAAIDSGAKIVMCCGFDSIPSDMGVYAMQRRASNEYKQQCERITLLVRAMRGSASGGTLASFMNAIDEARADRNVARMIRDPYGLNPEDERNGPDGYDQQGARFDDDAQTWTAPFIMAGINTRVVRRSNALSGYAYGRDFRYHEASIAGKGFGGRVKATLMGLGLHILIVMVATPFARRHLVQRFSPKPGEGPSASERENGFFKLLMVGRLSDGTFLRQTVTGDRDPGYGSTSKMLAESAVCLAKDNLNDSAGCLTPSIAMGDALLDRLQQNAGLKVEPE